jgi:hypothetical protein
VSQQPVQAAIETVLFRHPVIDSQQLVHRTAQKPLPVHPELTARIDQPHLGLCCAVPNGRYLEYIPQLDMVTSTGIRVEKGMAIASQEPGNGIEWDWAAIDKHVVHRKVHSGK